MNKSSLLLILIWFLCYSCQEHTTQETTTNSSSLSSIQDSIQYILSHADSKKSIYENSARITALKSALNNNANDANLIFNLAKEQLNKGETSDAICTILKLIEQAPELTTINDKSKTIHEFLAICYLRTAEQENCQNNHTDQSCIIPISGGGIHKKQEGSTKAIEKYTELLEVFPDDYQSRWLLNVAYMTLDKYPQDVPRQLLIPINPKDPKLLFENIASFTGTDHYGLSGSVVIDDFNNDGRLDIIASTWGIQGQIKYYINNGNLGFEDRSSNSGLANVKGGLNLKQADFNNDGYLDFIILRGAWRPESSWGILPNSLLKNNGDGTFTDVTIETGMYSTNPTQTAEWVDFNNDGWIDLFIANETTNETKEKFPCELYQNNRDGTFKNMASAYGVNAIGYFKGCSSGDINNDGLMDLYLSNLRGDNMLFVNEGRDLKGLWSFKNIAPSSKVTKPYASFPTWIADMNNDGLEDICNFAYDPKVFTNLTEEFAKSMLSMSTTIERSKIYLNVGDLNFNDASATLFPYQALGTMGCNYGDVNNDGYLDIYLGTGTPDYRSVVPNRFFINNKGVKLEDLTFSMGMGHIQKGHGIAFGDLDNDGDEDVYAVMGGAFEGDKFHNALFNNPGNDNDWIKVKLIGTRSNKSAIGAKIKLTLEGNNMPVQNIYHKVSSGSSFGGNPLISHIGIPKGRSISSVEVLWPNGKTDYTDYGSLTKKTYYVITEDGNAVPSTMNTFEWVKQKLNHNDSHQGHQHHH